MTKRKSGAKGIGKGALQKRMTSEKSDGRRNWSELHMDILVDISMKLNLIDHLAFSGVCKSWRMSAIASKRDIIASQPPMVIMPSINADKVLSLYNIFEDTTYKIELPSFAGKDCCGLSSGYLVFEDRKGQDELWLINPITGHELKFPSPPTKISHATITSPTTPSNSSIVALSTDFVHLLFYRLGDDKWTIYNRPESKCFYADIIVFKEQVYVLTSNGKILNLRLQSDASLTLFAVCDNPVRYPIVLGRFSFYYRPNVFLVASDDELMMINFRVFTRPKFFKVDIETRKCVVTNSLGGKALFIADMSRALISNPTKWGGRNNCIYALDYYLDPIYVLSLEGKILQTLKDTGSSSCRESTFFSSYWYFPNKCFLVDKLSEK